MDKQLEILDNFLNSEKGKEYMINYWNQVELSRKFEERWTDRIYNRIKNNINESIEKVMNWYNSDKYRNREYKLGREPMESLFWILFDIAQKYGRPAYEIEWQKHGNMFTGDIFIIGSYAIQVMHGQGSVIRIDKIDYEN